MTENKETALALQERLTEVAVKPTGGFVESFRNNFKVAQYLSHSNLIPQQYQGKTEDCAIAVEGEVEDMQRPKPEKAPDPFKNNNTEEYKV